MKCYRIYFQRDNIIGCMNLFPHLQEMHMTFQRFLSRLFSRKLKLKRREGTFGKLRQAASRNSLAFLSCKMAGGEGVRRKE